jgi:hypothetical protein
MRDVLELGLPDEIGRLPEGGDRLAVVALLGLLVVESAVALLRLTERIEW